MSQAQTNKMQQSDSTLAIAEPFTGTMPTADTINKRSQQFIHDRVNEIFNDVFSFYDSRTMEKKDPAATEEYFCTIDRHVNGIGKLCKSGITVCKVRYKGNTSILIKDDAKRLGMIWDALRIRVQAQVSIFVDHFLDPCRDSEWFLSDLVNRWGTMHANYQLFIKEISPLLEYIVMNYPSVAKEVTRELKIGDYFEMYLISLLRSKLSDHFMGFLEAFLSYLRQKPVLARADLEMQTPLTLMYKYRIPLDNGLTLKDFYFESIGTYSLDNIDVMIDLFYCENLTKFLIRNALITGTISAMLIKETNEIILRNTLMEENTAQKFFESMKDYVNLNSIIGVSQEISSQLAIILTVFESRSMMDELERIYAQFINSTLMKAITEGLEESMKEACKLALLVKGSSLLDFALKEIISVFGGPINVMERYLRLCENCIRTNNHENITGRSQESGKGTVLLLVPNTLKISPQFLDLYSRSLFRRFILHGPTVIETLQNPCFLECQLLEHFSNLYKLSPEFDRLQTLKIEIFNSSQIAQKFEAKQSETALAMTPLILEKNKVPLVFQENAIASNLPLTEDMQKSWDKLKDFYPMTDKRAQFKKLFLVDYLQHFEVETQIILNNSKPLVLDLSFHQTRVLCLFNDSDSLTLDAISSRSKINRGVLTEVLKSFLNIGLLVSDSESYLLNEEFSPDESKIRNGLLRVRMGVADSKSSHLKRIESPLHMEGQVSYWKQELIRACIVRSLKSEERGLKPNDLFAKVRSQIYGTSVGEFKDALKKNVDDKMITKWRNCYKY